MAHHHHQHGPHEGTESALAELLDLDADVLHAYLLELTTWVRQQAADLSCRRILDLGAGTGTGTVALAERFSEADVTAVDQSGEMLTRVRARARSLGFAHRIRTVQADLDSTWPALEPVDLVWASNSLHEMADPGRILNDVFTAIRPGGLLVVAEMEAPPRFLPHDIGLGVPGLEERCHDALGDDQAGPEPRLGSDWGPYLERSGFAITARRTFPINLTSPQPAATGRYARAYLGRIRSPLEGRLNAGDLAALDAILDSAGPGSVLSRGDLVVRGTRTAWMARRP